MRFNIGAILFILTSAFSMAQKSSQDITIEIFNESDQRMPETVVLKSNFKGKIFSFMYKKVQRAQTTNHANYIETLSVAEMTVKRKENQDGYLYEGSFIHKGVYFLIYPASINKVLDPNLKSGVRMIGEDEYIIAGQVLSAMSGDSYGTDVIPSDNHQALTVELFVHIDYSLYVKWLKFKGGNVKKALKFLKNYYSHIIHGVNVNYERINRADFSISIHLKTLYVQTTASIYVDKDYNVTTERIEIDGNVALKLSKDLFDARYDRGQYDAGLFFGNFNLNGAMGIAYERSMCFDIAVALVSHSNQLELTNTATHELGHILGSDHDGYPYNHCRSKDMFIMSFFLDSFNTLTVTNTFKFSQCSISYIRLYVHQLNREKNNCLLNAPRGEQDLQKDNRLLGQLYTPNKQCQLLHGPESYFCGSHRSLNTKSEEDVCRHLSCYYPLLKHCRNKDRQSAADGTKCGNKKWCLDGVCVQNGRASSTYVI